MGVFDRFERRLERLVEGAFGRVFKGEAAPADIAHALQRESDDRKVVVGPGRVIAPNAFVVVLGDHDHGRLAPYQGPLAEAFAEMLQDHAQEEGYSLAGPVRVQLEHDPVLDTGRFQIRSDPAAVPAGAARTAPQAHGGVITGDPPAPPPPALPRHRVVITAGGSVEAGTPPAGGREVSVPLVAPVTVIGRSAGADVRLVDPGVSRRHAELHLTADVVRLVDAGSTNGTTVNGEAVSARQLRSGDRIQVGSTVLVYRSTD